MMAAPDVRPAGGFSPVAVVWCRQVDNEAESPGYTTIPEEFPGRRETLETIRLVGNLTVNVADTHDYWDPDPAQTLSYYPNLFLYPAGNGRYTCVGRMFLSTEDRPRLGMKTLVLETAQLVAGGSFGSTVLQAWASMGGRPGAGRPRNEPEAAVYQAVGEGFLFHRGTTEPVVIVAADQWDGAIQAIGELLRLLPTALIALGAFLVFPYFLPEGKVNLHEFSEQVPLALAVMRVPEREALGDRHAKRIQSWEAAPVALRDLTKPPTGKGKDPLPLVLQYVRDHADDKIIEVSRRVDLVEASRLRGHLEDPDHQAGRDRRKEMWRIGTAMESAAILLARPRGRSVPMTGEAAKRANQYLQARPMSEGGGPTGAERSAPPVDALEASSAPSGPAQLPPWLQRPPEVNVPPPGPIAVPVSVSDDPSTLPRGVTAPAPLPAPDAAAPAPSPIVGLVPATVAASPEAEARLRAYVDHRLGELASTIPPPSDPKALDSRISSVALEAEVRANSALDRRLREVMDQEVRARDAIQASFAAFQTDLVARLAALEARPVTPPTAVRDEVSRQIDGSVDPKLAEMAERSRLASKTSLDAAVVQMRGELAESIEEVRTRATRSEEELRAALVAQMDLELQEAKDQGSALREQIEARIREILQERLAEVDARRTRETRELEQKFQLLIDGRAKDLEARVTAAATESRDKILQNQQEQIAQVERRIGLANEARLSRAVEAQTQSVAGLQVRLQSYFDQRLREDQEREREKYVELLARFKTEVDQALAHTIDSTLFDNAVRSRVAETVETMRLPDQKTLDLQVAAAAAAIEAKLATSTTRLSQLEAKLAEREAAIADVEQRVRRDLEELDRRLQVMADRMVPLVRNTWLKVDELQKGGGPSAAADTKLRDFRREFGRELRRLEGEMLEQTTELRDRMEGAIAHQGRIWLNFVRQMAASDDEVDDAPADAETRSLRRATRAAVAAGSAEPRQPPLRSRPTFAPFDDDPVNPMDPSPETESPVGPEPVERRRTRRPTA
jgi:hypothetical protein